jgi:GNAT superfamily N-acetyltransferase
VSAAPSRGAKVEVKPLTAVRWKDLEALFGARGACGGCWCMAWRLSRGEWVKGKGALNRAALKRLASREPSPGVLAYIAGEPVGWCAIAPREAYPVLSRSRVLAPVDERPVWSVSCFFVARAHRRRGVTTRLLQGAVAYAASCGARHIEGYPVASRGRLPDVFVWTGLPRIFEKAGFREVARRSPTRPIMRRRVRAQKTQA